MIMTDYIFGQLMFGESWNETQKAIKLLNPINDAEHWIPKSAIIDFKMHKRAFEQERHFAQNIYLKVWFKYFLKKDMKDPHNERRFNAQATFNALNIPRKQYQLEKYEYDKNRYIPPTGLPL